MQKKTWIGTALSLAAAFLIGSQMVALAESDQPKEEGMMNGNGMAAMMQAMHTPEGQEMMKACSKFMDSYADQQNGTGDLNE